MGLTRQAVQRIADLLVDRGLAEYRPNPDHRRAKLLACTEAGAVVVDATGRNLEVTDPEARRQLVAGCTRTVLADLTAALEPA